MPADFDRCIAKGGRVVTKTLSGGRTIKLCYLDGKSYAGEVHARAKPPAKGTRKKG